MVTSSFTLFLALNLILLVPCAAATTALGFPPLPSPGLYLIGFVAAWLGSCSTISSCSFSTGSFSVLLWSDFSIGSSRLLLLRTLLFLSLVIELINLTLLLAAELTLLLLLVAWPLILASSCFFSFRAFCLAAASPPRIFALQPLH